MTLWRRFALLACLIGVGCSEEPEGSRDERPQPDEALLRRASTEVRSLRDRALEEGLVACCLRPLPCALCPVRFGSCDCGQRLEAGEAICPECRTAWQAGSGNGSDHPLSSIPPTNEELWRHRLLTEWLPRLRSGPRAVGDLFDLRDELVLCQRYACCTEIEAEDLTARERDLLGATDGKAAANCLLCVLEGKGCDCAANLVASGGTGPVCPECETHWRAGFGTIPGVDVGKIEAWPDEMSLERRSRSLLEEGSGD